MEIGMLYMEWKSLHSAVCKCHTPWVLKVDKDWLKGMKSRKNCLPPRELEQAILVPVTGLNLWTEIEKSLECLELQLSFAPLQTQPPGDAAKRPQPEVRRLQYCIICTIFSLVCFSAVTIIYCSKLRQTITNSHPVNMSSETKTTLTGHEWVCDGSVRAEMFSNIRSAFGNTKNCGKASICTCQNRPQVPFFSRLADLEGKAIWTRACYVIELIRKTTGKSLPSKTNNRQKWYS